MINKKYLIFLVTSYVVASIISHFSLLATWLLLIFYGIAFAIPFYKFVQEQEKNKSQEHKAMVAKKQSKHIAIGNIFTFLGVLIASLITVGVVFKVINFVLTILVILIKGFITV